MKNKVVIWSGGLDSTVLLTEIAKKYSTNKTPVYAISIISDAIDKFKTEKESEARNRYLEWATKNNLYIKYNEIHVSCKMQPHARGWTQAMLWLCYAYPFIQDNSDVYFGYILGDRVWLAVNSILNIVKELNYINHKKVKFQYPFAYVKKWEILDKFLKYKIPTKCVWTCELPIKNKNKIVSCKKCEPCITLKAAYLELCERKNLALDKIALL